MFIQPKSDDNGCEWFYFIGLLYNVYYVKLKGNDKTIHDHSWE